MNIRELAGCDLEDMAVFDERLVSESPREFVVDARRAEVVDGTEIQTGGFRTPEEVSQRDLESAAHEFRFDVACKTRTDSENLLPRFQTEWDMETRFCD